MNGGDQRRVPWDDYLAMHAREISLVVLAIVAIAIGCFAMIRAGRNELAGSVTSGGRPVVYGTVTVVASDGRVYTAPLQADGTYRIASVPPGPVRVAVSSPNPRSIIDQMGAAEATAAAMPAQAAGAGPRSGGSAGTTNGSAGASGGDATEAGPRRPRSAKDEPVVENVTVAAPNGPAPPFPSPAASRRQERQEGWFRIPGRYASPATSGIRTDVRRGRTPFDIKVD